MSCTGGGIFLKPLPNDMMASLDKRVIYGLYEIGRELPDYCAHIYTLCKKSVGFFDLDQALVDTSARQ